MLRMDFVLSQVAAEDLSERFFISLPEFSTQHHRSPQIQFWLLFFGVSPRDLQQPHMKNTLETPQDKQTHWLSNTVSV